MDTEELIRKCKEVYGNEYILDNIEYVKGNKCYIYPECRKHGIFRIRYDHFLNGHGCKKCSFEKLSKLKNSTTEEFIEKLNNIAPNKFDTSKVDYKNAITDIILICHEKDEFGNEHGEFITTPNRVLEGEGCPKCAGRYVYDTNSFIERVKNKFNDIEHIDFSQFEYKGSRVKSTFICHKKDNMGNEHGKFEMTPNNFLQGKRCPKCAKVFHYTTDTFINIFLKNINYTKYDTSKVAYVNDKTPIILICHKKDELGNEHGEFQIAPYSIRNGCGCPKCNIRHKLTQENFERRVNKIFDEKYDLSLSRIINMTTKIPVICHEVDKEGIEHGIFYATPQSLLSGHGCPKCGAKNNKTELKLYNYLCKKFKNVIYNYRDIEILGKKSIDCYLPEYKIGIECQGLQHFMPVEMFGGEDEYELVQKRDKDKYQECFNNGIRLIYYKNTKKNVECDYDLCSTFDEVFNKIQEIIDKDEKIHI